jgi:hypothetical protein
MQNVKIPQNVKVEDKLIGPFSLKQLILVALGGGSSYMLYASIQKSVGIVPAGAHAVIWWPAILSVAFALIRINDISLFRYCLLIIETMSKPRQRVFQARQGLVINIQTRAAIEADTKAKAKKAKEVSEQKVETSPVKLDELSTILDAEGRKKSQVLSLDPLETNVDSLRSTVTP